VFIDSTNEQNEAEPISPLDYLAWREQARSFTDIGLYNRTTLTLTGQGDPERLRGVRATANLLPLLGLNVQLGRLHTMEEDTLAAEPVLLLTDRLWRRKFDSRTDVLGQSIALNGEAHTIIGVLPPEFDLEQMWFQVELLIPLRIDRTGPRTVAGWYTTVGRLRPDVVVEQAQAEMDVIAAGVAESHPETNAGRGARVRPLMKAFISPNDRLAFQGMLFAVGLVLVIACANLANLLLARATARGREFAVRAALGAGRSRIVRQLLTESFLLAGLGGALGLIIGTWTIDIIVASLDFLLLQRHEVGVSSAVILYTVVLSVVAALVSGLAPALIASRPDVNEALKEGQSSSSAGRSRNRLRHALVVGQLAVALPLLISSGLTLRHVQGIKGTDFGFNPERLLTMRVDLPEHRYSTEAQWATFYGDAVRRIGSLPGIEGAGAATGVPAILLYMEPTPVVIEGGPEAEPGKPDYVAYQPMTPGFLRTLEVPLVRGRFFSERDRADGLPVGMINSQMARRYWPDENPVGRRLRLGEKRADARWITIVGEVSDTGRKLFGEPPDPTLYVPHEQAPRPGMSIAVKTSGDPMAAIPALRGAIHTMDEGIPVRDFQTVQGLIHEICRDDRLAAGSLAVLAALSLGLASIGLYGVMSFLVEQRTREIGVRVALGAGHGGIMQLILKRCLRLAALGIVAGLVLAIPVGLGMESQLWGVSGIDPVAYAGVSIVLLLVALLAGYVPARRATKVDPMTALRCE
jgi:putative ABC transport system permease protein